VSFPGLPRGVAGRRWRGSRQAVAGGPRSRADDPLSPTDGTHSKNRGPD
jgi:hypothetical protein